MFSAMQTPLCVHCTKLTHSGAAVCKTPRVILICSQVLEPLTPKFKEQVSGPTSPQLLQMPCPRSRLRP